MAEPKFVPKDGQVDFTHARYSPVVNCVVEHDGKILLVKRNSGMRLYPSLWNGISGFLDDQKSVEEKVQEELSEEVGIKPADIQKISVGPVLVQEDTKLGRTWIVFPVHVVVAANKYKLDPAEASEAKWLSLTDARKLKLMPGFAEVLGSIFNSF